MKEKRKNVFTSEVLESYENSLINYLENLEIFVKIYKAKNENIELFFDNSKKALKKIQRINYKKAFENIQLNFNFADFKVWLFNRLQNADIFSDLALQKAFLPFSAWCQHKNLYKSGQDSFLVVLELAKNQI